MNLFNNLYFLNLYHTLVFFCLGGTTDMRNPPISKNTLEKHFFWLLLQFLIDITRTSCFGSILTFLTACFSYEFKNTNMFLKRWKPFFFFFLHILEKCGLDIINPMFMMITHTKNCKYIVSVETTNYY